MTRILLFMIFVYRLQKDKTKEKEQDVTEIRKHLDLILAPQAPQRQQIMDKVEQVAPKKMEVE